MLDVFLWQFGIAYRSKPCSIQIQPWVTSQGVYSVMELLACCLTLLKLKVLIYFKILIELFKQWAQNSCLWVGRASRHLTTVKRTQILYYFITASASAKIIQSFPEVWRLPFPGDIQNLTIFLCNRWDELYSKRVCSLIPYQYIFPINGNCHLHRNKTSKWTNVITRRYPLGHSLRFMFSSCNVERCSVCSISGNVVDSVFFP